MNHMVRQLRDWDEQVRRQANDVVAEFSDNDSPVDLASLASDLERKSENYDDGPEMALAIAAESRWRAANVDPQAAAGRSVFHFLVR
jgi:hypothetical protein